MRGAIITALIISASGCDGTVTSKSEARALNGIGPDGQDLCEENGWYGDSECDDWCPLEDPDCAGVDAGAPDASRDAGARDAGLADVGTDGGPVDAGHDAGATGSCGAAMDAGSPDPEPWPLPDGFPYGSCTSASMGPWAENVLRGPGSWQRVLSSSINHVWPVELDPGQTLVIRPSAPEGSDGVAQALLARGPCKIPDVVMSDVLTYTATAHENWYLQVLTHLVRTLEIEIIGAAASPVCAPCDTSHAIDVSRDSPFEFGTFGLPSETSSERLPLPGAVSAPGSISCSGVRHLGNDALFRVHMRAGEQLSATAFNPASMGPDPLGAYLVRDCNDLTVCLAAEAGGDGAGIGGYVAPRDEILYLVIDTFDGADYAPTYVRVTVTSP